MTSTLKQKAVSGMLWIALQRYSTIFIQFVSGIILARLLTPYEYGCIGMLTIFMMLAQTFIDSGFGSALIQKKEPTQTDYSSIFWWNIGMAVVMYAVLFVSASFIARFYRISLISNVLRVQGAVLFIYAFNIIQQNQLRKNLNFKLLSVVAITTSFIALLVTIWMAYKGYGVWSLVAQYILTAAIPAVVFWFTVKWRPVFVFSTKSFKELFGFGFYMFMTDILNTFSKQIQGLVIGKVYTPSIMGYYSMALKTEDMASLSVSQIITQVAYPLYAEVQDDREHLCIIIKRLTTTLAYIVFPLMFVLLLCAKPLFIILYSDKWLSSVPYFQVLCLSGLAYCLQSVNLQPIAAIGKSWTMFKWTIVKRVIGLSMVLGGLALYGIKGLLCGVVLHNWFAYVVNMGLVSKHIGYKWSEQLWNLAPILLVSIVASGISYSVGLFLSFTVYFDGMVKIATFLIIYAGWSFLFKPESFVYFKDIVSPLIKKLLHRG